VIAALFVTYAAVALFNSVNALRRPVEPGHRLPPLWLPAMVVSELAGLVFASRLAITAGFGALGVLSTTGGRAGFVIMATAQIALLPQFARTRAARRQASEPLPPVHGWKGRLLGRPDTPSDLILERGIRYHDDLTLDIYRSPRTPDLMPVLVYAHGGSWRSGDPHNSGRAMFHALARAGWARA
jgi:acetyl esterase/lipase